MTQIGTKFTSTAKRVLLCGSGELGKEVVIELQRLGVVVELVLDRLLDPQRVGDQLLLGLAGFV